MPTALTRFHIKLLALWDDAKQERRRAGQPFSVREIAKALRNNPADQRPSPQRLSAWTSTTTHRGESRTPELPSLGHIEQVIALVRLLSVWAGHTSFNEQKWRTLHEQSRPGRAPAASAPDTTARWDTASDSPRPLREWSAARLGVHAAIPCLPEDGVRQGFLLPTYVERSHDSALRKYLTATVDAGETAVAVVRGASCTGKTRSAYEAVRAVVPDWNLLFPADADSLLAALAADRAAPGTVLWLDDAQRVLHTAAGEAAAAALARRCDQPGPVIVVITLWPQYYSKLIDDPADGSPDPHQQARALLTQARLFSIPSAFSPTDLRALEDHSYSDVALAVARRTGSTGITQVLAAGPDLVDHYQHPTGDHGPYGQAVISAAMDARRLGVTSPLSLAFLHAAAPGYLTDTQRAAANPDTWFDHSLDYARTRVKDVIAALNPVARPAGMGAAPNVVQLEDYLDHHGRKTRGRICPPATFWDAAVHLSDPDDLIALASAARERWRYRHAHRLYELAVQVGSPRAQRELTELQKELNESDSRIRHVYLGETAVRWFEKHPLLSPPALESMAWIVKQAGDREHAKRLFQRALTIGCDSALLGLAQIKKEEGDWEGAAQLRQQATDAGFPIDGPSAGLPTGEKEGPKAKPTDQLLVRIGYQFGVQQLENTGLYAAADHLAQRAADDGHPEVSEFLANRRQIADECKHPEVLKQIAEARQWVGDQEAAERFARLAAEAGDPSVLSLVARLRLKTGDKDEEDAKRLFRLAADAGDPYALGTLMYWQVAAGDWDGAERLAWQAAEAGDPFALGDLAKARLLAGDSDGAKRLAQRGADVGDPYTLGVLAHKWQQAGDLKGAERLARQAADAGDLHALRDLAGDQALAQSQQLLRYGLDADGQVSEAWRIE